jgi:hypothetical protein
MQLACAATGGALLPRIRRLVMPPPDRVGNSGFWAGGALAGVLLLSGLAACLAGSESNPAAGAARVTAGSQSEMPVLPSRLSDEFQLHAPLGSLEVFRLTYAPDSDIAAAAAVPPVDTPRGTAAAALFGPVAFRAVVASSDVVLPNDTPGEIAPGFPTQLTAARAMDVAPRAVIARREFRRPAADPVVQLPMSIPNEIIAMVRRDLGYWPLGATSIRVTPNGNRHIQILGKTANQTASEREWMVQSSEASRAAGADTVDITGDIRLSIDPGHVYQIPFEIWMRTQPDPRSPGQLATADAQLTWFAPTATHPQPIKPVPQQAYVPDAAPDLMLHPASACWEAGGVAVTITRDNSPAVNSMTRAGLASPNSGTPQGSVQRNAQPLMRESPKSDDKQH